MPENDLDAITKIKLESLREALKAAESNLVALRAENSKLRVCGIQDLTDLALTHAYKEQFLSVWSQVDIDRVFEFLNLIEWHQNTLTELYQLKRRTLTKKQLEDRDKALVKSAEDYRQKVKDKKQGKLDAALEKESTKRKPLTPREKVINAWMKRYGVTAECAENMLAAAESNFHDFVNLHERNR